MHRLDLGDQLFDRADQREGGVDHVRRQIAHRAVGVARGPPGRGRGRIGVEILGMLAPEPRHVADPALRDQGAGVSARRRADVVEADHVGLSGGLGRGNHRAGIVETGAERLFAQNRFAGRERRLGDGPVRRLRRGDDHRADRRIGDQFAPVRRGAREAVGRAIPLGRSRARGAHHFQTRAQAGVEHRADRRHGDRMGLAHVAAADDADPDVSQCPSPPDSVCNRLQILYPRANASASRNISPRHRGTHREDRKSHDR